MEKEDLKRLSKEVAKKLVRGDYKSGRVKDPTTKLSSKHEKTVKTYVKDFLDKAVRKKEERDRQRAARAAEGGAESPAAAALEMRDIEEVEWDDEMMDIKAETSASLDTSPAGSASELKRKREDGEDSGSPKKSRMGTDELQSAPPPPPPPPADDGTEGNEGYGSLVVGERAVVNGNATTHRNGYGSPMQLATPSTNGLSGADRRGKNEVNRSGDQ